MIRAIIVDDIEYAVKSLLADVAEFLSDRIKIVGTANGVLEAAKLVKSEKPELIFLDIHMTDGDGFDLLDIIDTNGVKVIFTTASEDHAIQAFGVNAIDYLLKPIDSDRLIQAIDKFENSIKTAEVRVTHDTISLSTSDEIRRVEVSDIIRMESMGNYTQFYLKDQSKILVTKTLKEYDSLLDDRFIRVHQSHLVNTDFIKSYIKTEGGYLLLLDGSHVPVSVRKKPFVIQFLSQ